MKTYLILSVAVGIAGSSLAWADAAPNPATLGTVDGVLSFCAQANPDHEGAYKALKVSLIGKQSDRTLDAIEHTSAYHQAFTQIRGVLDSAAHDWAVSACRDILPANSRGGHQGDDHDGHDNH